MEDSQIPTGKIWVREVKEAHSPWTQPLLQVHNGVSAWNINVGCGEERGREEGVSRKLKTRKDDLHLDSCFKNFWTRAAPSPNHRPTSFSIRNAGLNWEHKTFCTGASGCSPASAEVSESDPHQSEQTRQGPDSVTGAGWLGGELLLGWMVGLY